MLLTNAQFQKIKNRKTSRHLNDGSQTNAYLCKSKIIIFAGNRGNGKTHLILSKVLPFIGISEYRCAYMRKEVKDATGSGGIVDASKGVFGQFGVYLESAANMYWKFQSGARASFMNYSAPLKEFQDSVQGKEYAHVFVDEITQIAENKFKTLCSNLRNTYGVKTQILGTCNADPESWVSTLISWWIDPETGFHIPEKDGKERFFFQFGNTIAETIWGDTREEVFELAKDYIMPYWDAGMDKHNSPLDVIMSISVFEGKMSENERLMRSGGGGGEYLGQLLMGSTDMKNRYARACWKKVDIGDTLITEALMHRLFDNSPQTTGIKAASLDISGLGSDKAVLFIWDGCHITNCYMTSNLDAKALKEWTIRHLNQEGVPVKNFVYDAVGCGYAFSGYFDDSTPFISNARVSEAGKVKMRDDQLMKLYFNAKAEVIGKFLDVLRDLDGTGECGISIEPELLTRIYYGKTLKEHLLLERKAVRWREDKEGVMQCIDKKTTISVIGHSADVFMALIYRFALDVGQSNFKPMEKEQVRKIHNFLIKR